VSSVSVVVSYIGLYRSISVERCERGQNGDVSGLGGPYTYGDGYQAAGLVRGGPVGRVERPCHR